MAFPLFRDPERTTTKIVRDRTPEYTTRQGLVGQLEKTQENRVLIIEDRLIPQDFYSGQNHLKRGAFVDLHPGRSIDAIVKEAEEGKASLSRARNKRFHQLTSGDYAGYMWHTLDGKESRHVLLTHCIEGSRLWNVVTAEDPDTVKVKRYHSREESPRYGQTFDVVVPSCSGKGSYVFQMRHVAVDPGYEQYLAWRAMKSEGHTGGKKRDDERHEGCEFKYYIDLTHRRPVMTTTCIHEVVAHRAISSMVKQERGHIILQPYALPSQLAVDLYKKACRNVLIEETVIGKKGLHQLRRRPLSVAELEIVLWDQVVARKDTDLFYAHSNLRKYNWS